MSSVTGSVQRSAHMREATDEVAYSLQTHALLNGWVTGGALVLHDTEYHHKASSTGDIFKA